VHLLDEGLSFPNGIALSPDERTLYVANSDPERPVWMAYSLDAQGDVAGKRVFADASDLMGEGVQGLPDGLAVAEDGRLFATGPGGVLVFDVQGKRLGRIETGTAISNCAFGDDGRTLYMTSHNLLARIRVKARGLQFRR
jgi:gluconolactonase